MNTEPKLSRSVNLDVRVADTGQTSQDVPALALQVNTFNKHWFIADIFVLKNKKNMSLFALRIVDKYALLNKISAMAFLH